MVQSKFNHRSSSKLIIERALSEGRSALFEHEAELIASYYGVPVAKSRIVNSEKDAVSESRKIGFPIAMKIVSRDILHKSDVGGVILNIQSPNEVRKAYSLILRNVKKSAKKARIDGVLIQQMAERPPNEFVLGGLRDKQFGPTVMFGLGGIYVELFKDVSFRLAPLGKKSALSMIKSIRSSILLEGYRGAPPLDVNSTAIALSNVGEMMNELEEIESIDVNPLFIYKRGVLAADVRIILRTGAAIASNPKD